MKINLLFFALAIFSGVNSFFAQSIEKQVDAIRTEVNSINKQSKNYKKEVKDVEGISLEGTEATYFSSGKGLRKIVAKSYGESYKATTELYYSGEELIFVFQKYYRYDTQVGMKPAPKVVSVKEKRAYFNQGKLVKFLDGKVNVKPEKVAATDTEKEFIELSGQLKKSYSN